MEKRTTFDRYPAQWGIVFGLLAILPIALFADIVIWFFQMPTEKVLPALSDLFVTIGVIVAVVVYLTNVVWRKNDKEEHSSEFHLNRALEGLQIFYDLLKDRNNERVTWIQAARVLLDNNRVSERITTDTHRVIYEQKKDHIRHKLYEVLHPKNPSSGEFEPLPPSFFYGGDQWERGVGIDDAARASTELGEARRSERYGLPHTSKLSFLSGKSVVTIYEFLRYPENYEDRLDDVRLWDLSPDRCFDHLIESPWKYLKHYREHVVASGMCYPKGDELARRAEEERVYGEPLPD